MFVSVTVFVRVHVKFCVAMNFLLFSVVYLFWYCVPIGLRDLKLLFIKAIKHFRLYIKMIVLQLCYVVNGVSVTV